MTRKKQKDAIGHWAVLKPRVEEARKERDLDPNQKSDQDFWSTMKQAKKDNLPPAAPGMPIQEYTETSDDIGLQVQQCSA